MRSKLHDSSWFSLRIVDDNNHSKRGFASARAAFLQLHRSVGQLDGGGGTSLGNYALRTRRNDPINLTNVPPFSVEIRGLRQLPFRMLRMSGPPETPKPKGKMETEDTPQKKIGRPKGSKNKEKKKLTKKAETPTALTALT